MSIKELAGHVSLQTTQRYLHLSSKGKGQAIQAVGWGHTGSAWHQLGTGAPGPE